MLEHHWLQRRTSRLEVRLYRQGEVVGTTCTLDMNTQGIGVERRKLNLHEGEIIEIDLPENDISKGMEPHARRLVIHTGEVRCGLMYPRYG